MKRIIYDYNNFVRTYNKYRRKLVNLQKANKNQRRQNILQKHILRLLEKLSRLNATIKMTSVAGSVVVGAMVFTSQSATAQSFTAKQFNPFNLEYVYSRSAPTFADLDGDGDLDMLAGNDYFSYTYYNYTLYYENKFKYFENIGTAANPDFAAPVENPFGIIKGGSDYVGNLTPTFVDLDGDGDMDIVHGNSYGEIYFLENSGTPTAPAFELPVLITDIGDYASTPTFADIDGDGDLDMLSGEYYYDYFFNNPYDYGYIYENRFKYYENAGDALAPDFSGAPVINPFGLTGNTDNDDYRFAPTFIDIDVDGDFDLMVGNYDGDFYYYENTGTSLAPAFAAPQTNPFNLTYVGNSSYYSSRNSKPTFADLDNDGDMDLMAGDNSGDFNYYRQCAPSTATINPTAVCSYTSPSGQYFTAGGTFIDVIPNASGCDSTITINLTIESIADQSISPLNPVICGTGSTTIDLGSTQDGVSYYLRDDSDDSVIDGPIVGDGSAISLTTDVISSPKTYNVYAERIVNSTGLTFDGDNDYVDATSNVNLANSSFSIEFWAKKSVLSAGSDDYVIGLGANTNSNEALHIGFRGGNEFTFAFFGNDLNANSSYADTDWHHWAVTFDAVSKARTIYRDGVQVANDVSSSNFIGTGTLNIGKAYPPSSPWDNNNFTGNVDEVRIWTVVKTQGDIQANMNTCLTGSESDLALYYQFEDGSGSPTVTDITANGNNGLLENFDNNTAWGQGATVCSDCNLEMTQTVTVTILPALNTSTTVLNETITADLAGATYRWLDCDNSNAVIPGETGQSFTATVNGNYAVEITDNGCVDTSLCVAISTVSLVENGFGKQFSVYPNPSNGKVTINLGDEYPEATVVVRNTLGQEVFKKNYTTVHNIGLNIEGGSGVYFIEISSANEKARLKVVKK